MGEGRELLLEGGREGGREGGEERVRGNEEMNGSTRQVEINSDFPLSLPPSPFIPSSSTCAAGSTME